MVISSYHELFRCPESCCLVCFIPLLQFLLLPTLSIPFIFHTVYDRYITFTVCQDFPSSRFCAQFSRTLFFGMFSSGLLIGCCVILFISSCYANCLIRAKKRISHYTEPEEPLIQRSRIAKEAPPSYNKHQVPPPYNPEAPPMYLVVKTCRFCNSVLETNRKFCQRCKMEQGFTCPSCSSFMSDWNRLCIKCGNDMSHLKPTEATLYNNYGSISSN